MAASRPNPDDASQLASAPSPPDGVDPALGQWLEDAEPVAWRQSAGLRWVQASRGHIEQRMSLPAAMLDPEGRPAAGAMALLADSTLGLAAASTATVHRGAVTVSLSIDFPTRPGSTRSLKAVGTGRLTDNDTIFATGEMSGEDGRLLCTASLHGLMVDSVRDTGWGSRSDERNATSQSESAAPSEPEVSASGDGVRLTHTVPPAWSNGWGNLHGGAVAFLAERSIAEVIRRAGGPGRRERYMHFSIDYLRPIPVDGRPIVSEARIVHGGVSVTHVHGQVRRADGRIAARCRAAARVDFR
ncbi:MULTISPECIES: PaaI family thioesterase [unclassified Streptomyces]|uniref:PaaI family thioesterase n=1 Tax=unclassified Streptomyces TaxID=2593676 RepID=UPI00110F8CCD|nr:PaaI family thioesterase [Streptomyces sp. DASNCL29]TMU98152.1 PaaI family thioesterase [Streptomyces sp. DASNCL29]